MADRKNTPENDLQTQILLKEADEALRQEQMQNLWKEWGSTIVGVALMVVFGTMLGVGWKSWRESVHSQQTEILVAAQERGPVAMAMAGNDLSGEYAGMAALIHAGDVAAVSNTTNPAVAGMVYQKMVEADGAGLPRRFDILAEWGKLRTEIDANADAEPLKIAAELEKLAGKRGNLYAPLIMVESAILYGENGESAKAAALLDKAGKLSAEQNNSDFEALVHNLKTLYTSENNRT